MAPQLRTITQRDDRSRSFNSQTCNDLRTNYFDLELLRLGNGTTSQISAAQSRGKAEIVFDHRTQSRLAARCVTFDHHGTQALTRSINRCGQAGWTTTDDHEVVKVAFRTHLQSNPFCDLGVCRLRKFGAVGKDDHWQA
jgi:hypothetical protein